MWGGEIFRMLLALLLLEVLAIEFPRHSILPVLKSPRSTQLTQHES